MLDAFAEQKRIEDETVDVTLPGVIELPSGKSTRLPRYIAKIRDALVGLGFTTFEGPEIEYDDFNFTKLNPSAGSPRKGYAGYLLHQRQGSAAHAHIPCEARALMELEPPFRLVIPGRVFRVDEPDASHSPVFMQIEGLVVDKT